MWTLFLFQVSEYLWTALQSCMVLISKYVTLLRPVKLFPKWLIHFESPLVLLPGKSHGQRSLVGCSPWGHEESDMTERLHFHFSLACIGEGNGNPLQCSCLENPRDRGAWWAAVYGVAQSRTRLKWLSSSSSRTTWEDCLWRCLSNSKDFSTIPSICQRGQVTRCPGITH